MASNNWIATTRPGDYGTAGNWTDGVPTAGDAVALENSDIEFGSGNLNQSAVALASFIQYNTMRGNIGVFNLSGTPGTPGTYLQIATSLLVLGRIGGLNVPNPNPARVMIDLGSSTACTGIVESTCQQSADYGLPPVRLKGAKTDHVINVLKGWVGFACGRSDETSTFGTLNIGCGASSQQDCKGLIGPGVTINDSINLTNAYLSMLNSTPAMTIYEGGVCEHGGAGAVSGTVTVKKGGIYRLMTSGTIAAIVVEPGGLVDLSRARSGSTISSLTLNAANSIIENGSVTISARVNGFKGSGGGGGQFGGGA